MKATILSSPTLSDIRRRAWTSSTLLIPEDRIEYFNKRILCFNGRGRSRYGGSICGYFEYLIRNYANCLLKYGIDPTAIKWKKEYQEEGLELQKRNFKPEPDIWEKFRHISFSYGLSMCKMFVVLMELDHQRWVEAGCPDNFYELPQQRNYTPDFRMNSRQKVSLKAKKAILNALSSNKYTILIRNIDFSRQKLHRICMIT